MEKFTCARIAALLPLLLYMTTAGAMTCAPYYGQNYNEDFNSLASTGVSGAMPLGWGFIEVGPAANTTYTASDGSSATSDTYSFGNNSDRAIGGIHGGFGGGVSTVVGVCLVNRTGATIQSFDLGYRAEYWRHVAGNCYETRAVEYSTDATALDNGAWTNIPELGLSRNVGNPAAGATDGNVHNETKGPITVVPSGGWPPASMMFVRWRRSAPSIDLCFGIGFAYDDVTLTTKKCRLDFDGNGSIDPLTDGLILLRAMFGLTGNAVTNGALAANANRPNWNAIRGYVNDSCETNFGP